jgi:hypothetical protein
MKPLTAYDLARMEGFKGAREEFQKTLLGSPTPNEILHLKGEPGWSAYQVAQSKGFQGSVDDWLSSLTGQNGETAFDIAKRYGFAGSEDDWLESLKGKDGRSAYLVWRDVNNGKSLDEFFEFIRQGRDGDSAYDIWKSLGNVGSKRDFIESLKGVPGDTVLVLPVFIVDESGHLIVEINGERHDLGKVKADFAEAAKQAQGFSGGGPLRIVHFFDDGNLPASGEQGIIYVERGVGAFVWDAKNRVMVSISVAGGGGTAPVLREIEQIALADGAMTLTLPTVPVQGGTLYINGLEQRRSQYSRSGAVVTVAADMNILTGDIVTYVYS